MYVNDQHKLGFGWESGTDIPSNDNGTEELHTAAPEYTLLPPAYKTDAAQLAATNSERRGSELEATATASSMSCSNAGSLQS